MKIKMSKKGQGLGLVAVIILVALLYFVFRYNVDTYEFTMTAGDQQAHLVTGFVETEKAKVFAQEAFRQAAYESAWAAGAKTCDFTNICNNQSNFLANVSLLFDDFILKYEPTASLMSTDFPDYVFINNSCSSNKIEVEAYGFNEECFLSTSYILPKVPCEDQETQKDCTPVKFTDGKSNACEWVYSVDVENYTCTDYTPIPDCESMTDENSCKSTSTYCQWIKSYAEDINVLSEQLADYQFNVDTNAHFIETIDCTGYKSFIDARNASTKPICSLGAPSDVTTAQPIGFKITYRDDTAPKEIKLKILNSSKAEIANATLSDFTSDSADTNYFDGKIYSYTKLLGVAGTYNITLDCKDADSNPSVQIKKTIKVEASTEAGG